MPNSKNNSTKLGLEDFRKYLQETQHLDFNNPIFSETIAEITDERMTLNQKLEELFYFTRDSIPFDVTDPSLKASEALRKKKAQCYTKAMIYTCFCRRLGVPAKLAKQTFIIKADPRRKHHSGGHGIVKAFISEKWIYIDTVSNRDAWDHWGIPESVQFDPPRFTPNRDVVVGPEYYEELELIDFETNDVPEKWLKEIEGH